jgi:hypothetical protein
MTHTLHVGYMDECHMEAIGQISVGDLRCSRMNGFARQYPCVSQIGEKEWAVGVCECCGHCG